MGKIVELKIPQKGEFRGHEKAVKLDEQAATDLDRLAELEGESPEDVMRDILLERAERAASDQWADVVSFRLDSDSPRKEGDSAAKNVASLKAGYSSPR